MTTPTKALNLGCGKVLKMPGDDGFDEWVNSDLRDLQGVNRRFNAFVFPWPCEDEEFNHLYISHLVEHIPHTIREYKEWSINKDKLEPNWDEDGFFIFFRECHRILKPEGTIELIGPYARSNGADQDPTHTRYINEATFSYLWQASPTFDYQLGYKFNQLDFSCMANEGWETGKPDLVQLASVSFWNVFHSFRTILQKA